MSILLPVKSSEDILPEYRNTPIGLLLEYHNLNRKFDTFSSAQMLIGMCMDHRKYLRIPENFAYIMRTGGANLHGKEFNISYAIGVGNVRYMALIGHDHCGMSKINVHRDEFIQGMAKNAGWTEEYAVKYFDNTVNTFDIGEETHFTLSEVKRFCNIYPGINIAPLFYLLDTKILCQIIEK